MIINAFVETNVVPFLASLSSSVRLAVTTVVYFFMFSFFIFLSLCSTSFYLLPLPPFFSHSFQSSRNAVLLRHSRSSPCPISLHFLGSNLFVNFSFPILSTWPAHFNLLLTNIWHWNKLHVIMPPLCSRVSITRQLQRHDFISAGRTLPWPCCR